MAFIRFQAAVAKKLFVSRQYVRSQLTAEDSSFTEVILRGGLGNQLFGFAAGLDVARRLGSPLRLVTTNFSNGLYANRKFELAEVVEGLASVSPRIGALRVFTEAGFAYDSRIAGLDAPMVLDGYFQSPKYFAGSREAVREAIQCSSSFEAGRNFMVGKKFIAIHVRRGDFREVGQLRFHGLVPSNFFEEALAQLRKIAGHHTAIVFSDEFEVARQVAKELENGEPYCGDENEPPLTTLGAMASAQALAISNSSFGWWAGWLASPEAVIAPRPWFVDRLTDTSDLIEPNWLQLGRDVVV